MATTPAAILDAALAASGLTVAGAEGASRPAVGFASGELTVPVPAPGSEAVPTAPQLTPDQLASLAAANTSPQLPAGAPTRSPLMEKLIEKLGSEEAVAQMLIDQSNGAAALSRRLDSISSRLDAPPAPTLFDASADPQVKFHSDQLALVDADLKAREQEISTQVQAANAANQQVMALQGRLAEARQADNMDRVAQLQREIDAHQRDYDSAHAAWRLATSEARSLQRTKLEVDFKRQQAASTATENHQQSTETQKEETLGRTAVWRDTNDRFDTALVTNARRYGIPVDQNLRDTLVARFDRFITALPDDQRAIPVDLNWFVTAAMDAEAHRWGLTPKAEFTQRARDVAAAAGSALTAPPAQPPANYAPLPGTTLESLPLDQQVRAVKEHARRVLSQVRRA